jgi:hypothetical protein
MALLPYFVFHLSFIHPEVFKEGCVTSGDSSSAHLLPSTIFVVILTGIAFHIFLLATSYLITSNPNSLYSELVTSLPIGQKLGR